MTNRTKHGSVWLWVLAASLSFMVSSAYGASKLPPALEKLVPLAKAEGEVSLFTGSEKFTTEEEARVSQVFKDYYGIPIKIHLSALGAHPQAVQRVREEAKAGIKPVVDVFNASIKSLFTLQQAGLLEPIQWKELGVNEKDVIAPMNAACIRENIRGVVYNTNLVKRQDAPKNFDDFLDPKWKGKIVAPGMPTAFPFISLVVGEEKSFNLVKRLAEEQKMSFTRTITDVPVRVASGEFLIGYGWIAGLDKRRGAPIENAPMKVGGFREAGAVLRNAQHPNAARLLVHFLTSTPEGTKILYEVMNWAKSSTPGTDPYEIARGGGLLFSKDITNEIEWETKTNPELATRFGELLGF
jgi:iron(III) transport system substrate-binding protein